MIPSIKTSTMEGNEAISSGTFLGGRKSFPEYLNQASLHDSLAREGSHVQHINQTLAREAEQLRLA